MFAREVVQIADAAANETINYAIADATIPLNVLTNSKKIVVYCHYMFYKFILKFKTINKEDYALPSVKKIIISS